MNYIKPKQEPSEDVKRQAAKFYQKMAERVKSTPGAKGYTPENKKSDIISPRH